MKKLISLLIITFFLTLAGDLYAEDNKSEKAQKNENAVDAQKNWDKLKDDPEYLELNKYVEKVIKEEIKIKKRLRKEIKSDLNWDEIVGYTAEDVEDLIRDYVDGVVSDETLASFETALSEKALEKLEKALSKYEEALEGIASERQEEAEESPETEIEISDPNLVLKGGKFYYKEKLFTGTLIQKIPLTDQEIIRISYKKGLITSK